MLVVVYKSLHYLSPAYLSELLHPLNSVRPRRYRLKSRGDLVSAIAGPSLLNNLPIEISSASSMFIFKSLWKSDLLDQFETC